MKRQRLQIRKREYDEACFIKACLHFFFFNKQEETVKACEKRASMRLGKIEKMPKRE